MMQSFGAVTHVRTGTGRRRHGWQLRLAVTSCSLVTHAVLLFGVWVTYISGRRATLPVDGRDWEDLQMRRQRDAFARDSRRSFGRALRRPFALLAWIVGTLLAAGCDETFSPIQPSDLRLSIFGYLDASADTQWIRVMPIRPVTLTSPDALGATVSIKHLETGRVIELRDSLFRFSAINDSIGSEGIFVHNFWTTEPVDTSATYRFSATLEGGEPSEAVVTIPADYAVEVWIGQGRSADFVHLTGVQHVPFVGVVAYYFGGCGAGVYRKLNRIPDANSDEHTIRVGAVAPPSCGRPFEIDKYELWVVVSGSEWPSGLEHSTGALGLPDMPSSISNSVGFLGGVLTKRLPYESCRIGGFQPPEYCRLRYDAESASVRGTVRNTCGTEIEDAIVELREAGIEPPANYKIRSTISRASGEYEIAALEAAQRYALSVTGDPTDPTWLYHEYTDTLEFAPGEELTYDIELAGLDCGS